MSNISLGKKVRMSRMVNPVSNKMMAITVDHAISRGIAPMTGLHSIQSTIDKIVAGKPDAMTVTPGILNQCWDAEKNRDVAILCKVSNYSPVAPTQDIVFGNVDEAIALGASGVSMGAMTLGTYQGVQFETIGRFATECMQKGMPLIGHVYPKGESVPVEERTSWENIAYCIRSACEMGMDIVKTTYCGNPDAMAKALSTVPSGFRVVIQGGDAPAGLDAEGKLNHFLTITREAMDCGVGGVTMGRFVWDYPDVTASGRSPALPDPPRLLRQGDQGAAGSAGARQELRPVLSSLHHQLKEGSPWKRFISWAWTWGPPASRLPSLTRKPGLWPRRARHTA
ncbi:MAG: class I fructose-bisphosphate aldolase [Lawsonibacter sp.]